MAEALKKKYEKQLIINKVKINSKIILFFVAPTARFIVISFFRFLIQISKTLYVPNNAIKSSIGRIIIGIGNEKITLLNIKKIDSIIERFLACSNTSSGKSTYEEYRRKQAPVNIIKESKSIRKI
ncbi:hypothetical protein NST20_03780 [Weizmannia sp. FSL W8-0676]|uniref:hypothetical protein n=1 Tax=Weizmannia sp. FSL W8-0676 TaxID=2954703 RepID=UPI003159189B